MSRFFCAISEHTFRSYKCFSAGGNGVVEALMLLYSQCTITIMKIRNIT